MIANSNTLNRTQNIKQIKKIFITILTFTLTIFIIRETIMIIIAQKK